MTAEIEIPDDEDGAVLQTLLDAGVDLTRPLQIEFSIDVPDESAANAVAEAIRAADYDCEIDHDEGEPDEDGDADPDDDEFGPSWTIYVPIEMVPEHRRIVDLQAQLNELAAPHGGECDGWSTAV